MITIVNSGGANIASIQFALKRLGVDAEFSHDADLIKRSSHVILPGVGRIGSAMQSLHQHGLVDVLKELSQPVLGICLGMQLLFHHSEEDQVDCLQLIPGIVKKIVPTSTLTVPHMGWNRLKLSPNPLLNQVAEGAYVYFVHSYAVPIGDYTTAVTDYGMKFSAAIHYKNFYGTQFHPERSSQVGIQILKNFLEL
jgi:imidazole glycerol-phosphate synthase subunit HisH